MALAPRGTKVSPLLTAIEEGGFDPFELDELIQALEDASRAGMPGPERVSADHFRAAGDRGPTAAARIGWAAAEEGAAVPLPPASPRGRRLVGFWAWVACLGLSVVAVGLLRLVVARPAGDPSELLLAGGAESAASESVAATPGSLVIPTRWVTIPPGNFRMGSPVREPGHGNDETLHSVTITRPFLLQTTEVTQGQWRRVMGTSPSHFVSCGDSCPVERVSWWDVLAYCNALSRAEGLETCYEPVGCRGTPGAGCADGEEACEGDYRCQDDGFRGLACGGYPTISSYGAAAEAIPEEHIDLIRRCRRYYETSGHIFLHANYAAELPLADQPDYLLFWEHLSRASRPHCSGKTAVVGHTPQLSGEIRDWGHVVCIDTFCFGSGWLTAMDVESGDVWQADQLGTVRLQSDPR